MLFPEVACFRMKRQIFFALALGLFIHLEALKCKQATAAEVDRDPLTAPAFGPSTGGAFPDEEPSCKIIMVQVIKFSYSRCISCSADYQGEVSA